MLVLRGLFVSLTILCSLAGVSSTHTKTTCLEPAVRKEWRALSTEEKAEWIRAINVCNVTVQVLRGLNRFDNSACHVCRMIRL